VNDGNGRVVVVGSLNLDRRLELDRLPAAGETVAARRASIGPGGKGLNQAVAAARAGAQVELLACRGADEAGDRLEQLIRAEGIGTDGVVVLEDTSTGEAMVWVDQAGENCIVVVAGANDGMDDRGDDVVGRLGQMALVPADVVLAQGETSPAVTARAFAEARRSGARTILNLAPYRPPPSELLDATTVLVVNETEFEGVVELARPLGSSGSPRSSGFDDRVAAARAVLGLGPEVVIVTLGAAGAVAVSAERVVAVDGLVVAVVDTTGAGDGFVGALAAAMARAVELDAALAWATTAASLVVQRPGAAASMPSRSEIEGAAVRPISGS